MMKGFLVNFIFISFFIWEFPSIGYCQWNIVYTTDTLLTSVNFMSKDTGFVGGVGLLERTVDAGNNWERCDGFNGENQVLDIDFASNDLLYLSHFESQPIWISDNNGVEWENIPDIFVGGPIYDIDVVNDTVSYGGGNGGFVYYTKNGFDVLNIHNVGAADIKSISFPTVDTGYVAGGVDAFLKTEDGAQSWIDINFSPIFNPTLLDFCSGSTGYVTDGYDLYKTINYGESWIPVSIPLPMDRIIGLECVNEFVCYITGDDPFLNTYILKTIDGGDTWLNTSFESFLSPPDKIVCLNDSDCYALSSNGLGSEFYLLKTNNGGGMTFTQNLEQIKCMIFPNPASNFVSLSVPNSESIIEIVTYNVIGEKINLNFDNNLTAKINDLPSSYYLTEILFEESKYFICWIKQ